MKYISCRLLGNFCVRNPVRGHSSFPCVPPSRLLCLSCHYHAAPVPRGPPPNVPAMLRALVLCLLNWGHKEGTAGIPGLLLRGRALAVHRLVGALWQDSAAGWCCRARGSCAPGAAGIQRVKSPPHFTPLGFLINIQQSNFIQSHVLTT